MRWAVWLAAAGIALVSAGTASAGCMATVGLSPQPDVAAGETWTANVQVLQHGQTPMADATPSVIITNAATGEERTFPATLDGCGERRVSRLRGLSHGRLLERGGERRLPGGGVRPTHTFGTHSIAAAAPPSEPPAAAEPAARRSRPPPGPAQATTQVGRWPCRSASASVSASLPPSVRRFAVRARRNRAAGLA